MSGTFQNLNADVIEKITSYLSPKDLTKWKQTSKSMKKYLEDVSYFVPNVGIEKKPNDEYVFFYKNVIEDFEFYITGKCDNMEKFYRSLFLNINEEIRLNIYINEKIRFDLRNNTQFKLKYKETSFKIIQIDNENFLQYQVQLDNGMIILSPPTPINNIYIEFKYDSKKDQIIFTVLYFDFMKAYSNNIIEIPMNPDSWIPSLQELYPNLIMNLTEREIKQTISYLLDKIKISITKQEKINVFIELYDFLLEHKDFVNQQPNLKDIIKLKLDENVNMNPQLPQLKKYYEIFD